MANRISESFRSRRRDSAQGPSVVVWRDGQEFVISIVNYEGPAKVFWEYRSLAGPFYKGNVRNGFALWVAPRSGVRIYSGVRRNPFVSTTYRRR